MGDVPPLGIPVRREHLIRLPTWLWAALALFIVYGTLLPFHFVADRSFVADKLARITLNPLVSPDTNRRVSIPDVAQNVLLFLPFGVLGVLALDRSGANRAFTIARVTAIAAAFSALIEAMQLFTLDRTTSVTDLVAGTIGAFAGAVACYPLAARWVHSRAAARGAALIRLPAFYPLVAASLVVWAAAWAPFDITLDVGNIAGKLHAFRADPWQAGSPGEGLVATFRYLAFGLTLGLWLRQAAIRAAAPAAMIAGSVSAGALEASQWLIETRMPGLHDASIHVAATIAGAAVSVGWPYRRSPRFWSALWTTLTAIGATLELRVPMARDPMALVSRAFEIVLLIVPVVYGWYLAEREPGSYALR